MNVFLKKPPENKSIQHEGGCALKTTKTIFSFNTQDDQYSWICLVDEARLRYGQGVAGWWSHAQYIQGPGFDFSILLNPQSLGSQRHSVTTSLLTTVQTHSLLGKHEKRHTFKCVLHNFNMTSTKLTNAMACPVRWFRRKKCMLPKLTFRVQSWSPSSREKTDLMACSPSLREYNSNYFF